MDTAEIVEDIWRKAQEFMHLSGPYCRRIRREASEVSLQSTELCFEHFLLILTHIIAESPLIACSCRRGPPSQFNAARPASTVAAPRRIGSSLALAKISILLLSFLSLSFCYTRRSARSPRGPAARQRAARHRACAFLARRGTARRTRRSSCSATIDACRTLSPRRS